MNQNKLTEIVSYLLAGVFIITCFTMHLVSVLISGLTIYLLVTHFYKMISPKVKSHRAGTLTLVTLIVITLLVLSGVFFGIYSAVKVGNNNMQNMGQYAFNILQEIKKYLPQSVVNYIPDDILILKEKMTTTLTANSPHIFEMTSHSVKALAHVVIGLFLGAIVAFSFLKPEQENKVNEDKPFIYHLKNRIRIFTEVFAKVMTAQVKISGINTALTATYLLIVLPIFGIHLPYAKTLVLLTFVVGLIPVFGNLITNTLIFLISLTVGFKVAIASIIFLIVVHKLEYYVNARIVGHKIQTAIWELLLAMLIMETIFGIVGVALAPVIYGYIKEELKIKEII